MLTVQEVFEKTGVSESRIYYEIERGYIKTQKKYGRELITNAEFEKFKAKWERKRRLTAAPDYCFNHNITRNDFEGMVRRGEIETEKIDGEVFVTNDKGEGNG